MDVDTSIIVVPSFIMQNFHWLFRLIDISFIEQITWLRVDTVHVCFVSWKIKRCNPIFGFLLLNWHVAVSPYNQFVVSLCPLFK